MKTIKRTLSARVSAVIMIAVIACSCEKVNCMTIDCELTEKTQTVGLIDAIKYYQDKYVRKSINEFDCYTDNDLAYFRTNKTASKIKDELATSKTLTSLLDEAAKLSETERNDLFKKGLATCQPTWEQLGTISIKGQTLAGQAAQKEIAATVVNLIKEKGGYK